VTAVKRSVLSVVFQTVYILLRFIQLFESQHSVKCSTVCHSAAFIYSCVMFVTMVFTGHAHRPVYI
jgi:hypothetical protein